MDGFNLEEHTEKLEEGKETTYVKRILYNVPEQMCKDVLGKAKSARTIELGFEWKILPHPSNHHVKHKQAKNKKK